MIRKETKSNLNFHVSMLAPTTMQIQGMLDFFLTI